MLRRGQAILAVRGAWLTGAVGSTGARAAALPVGTPMRSSTASGRRSIYRCGSSPVNSCEKRAPCYDQMHTCDRPDSTTQPKGGKVCSMGKATYVGGGLGALLIAAAQTRPEEATSNIAAWLQFVGVDRVPGLFASSGVDVAATVAGAFLVVAAVCWAKLRPRKGRQVELSDEQKFSDEWDKLSEAERGLIRDRVSILEASLFMFFREWGHHLNELGAVDQLNLLSSRCKKMSQDAVDGTLDVWIRRERHGGVHIKAEPEYWADHYIDWESVLNGEPRVRANQRGRLTETFEPMVRRSDVERLYG